MSEYPDQLAWRRFTEWVDANTDDLRLIAHWGDGKGGEIARYVCDAVGIEFFSTVKSVERKPTKRALSKSVMERDAYRCVTCGSHVDLTVDHIKPVALGGTDDSDNLQTMCRSCNSKKGARYE